MARRVVARVAAGATYEIREMFGGHGPSTGADRREFNRLPRHEVEERRGHFVERVMRTVHLSALLAAPPVSAPVHYALDDQPPECAGASCDRLVLDGATARLFDEVRTLCVTHHGPAVRLGLVALPANAAPAGDPPRPVTVYGVQIEVPGADPSVLLCRGDTCLEVAFAFALAQVARTVPHRPRPTPPPPLTIARLATVLVATPTTFLLAGSWPADATPTVEPFDLVQDAATRHIVAAIARTRAALFDGVKAADVAVVLHVSYRPATLSLNFAVEAVVRAGDEVNAQLYPAADHPEIALLRAFRDAEVRGDRLGRVYNELGVDRPS